MLKESLCGILQHINACCMAIIVLYLQFRKYVSDYMIYSVYNFDINARD